MSDYNFDGLLCCVGKELNFISYLKKQSVKDAL